MVFWAIVVVAVVQSGCWSTSISSLNVVGDHLIRARKCMTQFEQKASPFTLKGQIDKNFRHYLVCIDWLLFFLPQLSAHDWVPLSSVAINVIFITKKQNVRKKQKWMKYISANIFGFGRKLRRHWLPRNLFRNWNECSSINLLNRTQSVAWNMFVSTSHFEQLNLVCIA